MTGWTAVVPIKPAIERKMRLRGVLDQAGRTVLTERMMAQVVAALRAADVIAEIAVLAIERPAAWDGRLIVDRGRGLNAELDAACREQKRKVIVVHADLPGLSPEDVAALAGAADRGMAIAPDRRGTGTNALALAKMAGFGFAFGPGSCARHVAAAGPRGTLVRRAGLAFDVDVPEDFIEARAAGIVPGGWDA